MSFVFFNAIYWLGKGDWKGEDSEGNKCLCLAKVDYAPLMYLQLFQSVLGQREL